MLILLRSEVFTSELPPRGYGNTAQCNTPLALSVKKPTSYSFKQEPFNEVEPILGMGKQLDCLTL